MNLGEYASAIDGVRLFKRRELAPVATSWDYQITESFSEISAQKIFTELPNGVEVCFFDPKEKNEEAYIFIRRVGRDLILRRGRHGYISGGTKESLEESVALLLASHFIQKPHPDFEAFTVTENK